MSLPKYDHQILPPNPNDKIWYRWFADLEAARLSGAIGTEAITAIAYILGSPDGTVANIPPLSDGLPLLNDTGVGLALLKITRDAYGRLEGTSAATTDDLAEGIANLYFTVARARAAAVEDTIVDGVTTIAPSQNAVFDALATEASARVAGDAATLAAAEAYALPLSYLDTDGTLAANSDTKVASQKATKTYVDTAVAGAGISEARVMWHSMGGM